MLVQGLILHRASNLVKERGINYQDKRKEDGPVDTKYSQGLGTEQKLKV